MLNRTIRNLTKAAFVSSVGRVPHASGTLDKLACWIRFSHWCLEHGANQGRHQAFADHRHSNRYLLYERVVQEERLDEERLDFLEFGVYQGESIRWWVERIPRPGSRFIGFDTFVGLPEGWDDHAPLGTFSTGGRTPTIYDPRCCFQVGLFQETVPKFLEGFERKGRLVLHLDADLYSSTLFVLTSLGSLLNPGDLLFFDEFSSPSHEFRAFDDFVKSFYLQYEVIGAVNNFAQACFKVK